MSNTDLGSRIIELRKQHNLTQNELAKILNIRPATLYSYESGTTSPPVKILISLSDKYNVSLDWLCGREMAMIGKDKSFETFAKAFVNLSRMLPPASVTSIKQPNEELTSYELYVEWKLLRRHLDDQETKDAQDALLQFFDEFGRMHDNYLREIIDDEIFELWLEKTIRKYSNIDLTETCN